MSTAENELGTLAVVSEAGGDHLRRKSGSVGLEPVLEKFDVCMIIQDLDQGLRRILFQLHGRTMTLVAILVSLREWVAVRERLGVVKNCGGTVHNSLAQGLRATLGSLPRRSGHLRIRDPKWAIAGAWGNARSREDSRMKKAGAASHLLGSQLHTLI